MTPTLPDADEALNDFATALSQSADRDGWVLIRHQRGHSDRDFELRGDGRRVAFTVKISLTEKGFWGLTDDKAQEIGQAAGQLILLNDSETGYFISAAVYSRLLPKFSRTREGAVRINEHVVRKEARFSDSDETFEMLKARAVTVAA